MAWRRRSSSGMAGYRNHDDRASIGDVHVEEAIHTISRWSAITAKLTLSYGKSREETLPLLFDHDVLKRAQAARGLIEPATKVMSYPNIWVGATLFIHYDDCHTPPLVSSAVGLQPGSGVLSQYLADLMRVHLQFEQVKGVIRWLNRNATPGAIRYFFPAAMKLTPKAPIWADLQEVPSRYSVPDGISEWLPILKEAATTVTGALMLPNEADMPSRDKLWVSFATVDKDLYKTDAVTYNIT